MYPQKPQLLTPKTTVYCGDLLRQLPYPLGMMTEHNRYHIKIKGHLQPCWQDWFDGLTIIQVDDGNTLLTGSVADQAALFGLLRKVRDLGMALLSIQCDETSLQTNIAPISQDTNQVLSNKEKEK